MHIICDDSNINYWEQNLIKIQMTQAYFDNEETKRKKRMTKMTLHLNLYKKIKDDGTGV